ncbi:MAG TPA: LysR family transcriptional regulator [Nannocystaceae bacterium]|nr:LysR family transcriptional regulator [Nannocystaceae bacterium]
MATTDLRRVDLNLLVALDALLEQQSVTGAASRVGLSPPAISHALARLRTLLGDPLLVRAGRSMVLTPGGGALKPRVRALVEELREVLAPMATRDLRHLDRTFGIHASDYALLVLGAELDARARADAPQVSLRFLPNTDRDAELLRLGEIDLAVGVYTSLPPEIHTQKLFSERLVCVVRAAHPGVRRRLTTERFAALEHIQVAPRGRPGGVVDDALARAGLRRRVTRMVPFFLSALHLVADTDCALTVPERVARATAERFGLRIVELPIEVAPYLFQQIWHPRNHADASHRWLRETMLAAAHADRRRK